MKTRTIDIPEELLDLLKQSRLASRAGTDQVRTALAIHLFLEGLVSIGKAAELAGEPRVEFEWLLAEMGLPTVRHELADADLLLLAEPRARAHAATTTSSPRRCATSFAGRSPRSCVCCTRGRASGTRASP